MTIIIDDAGSGDLLFGVVVGAFRAETNEFKYDVIEVKFYQDRFSKKEYFQEASNIALKLVLNLEPQSDEQIQVCQGNIFDLTVINLQKIYGEKRVKRVRVTGEAQRLVEIAYLDELRNLGYQPLEERETKRAKSFFHMMKWLRENPSMLLYAKTGWPRLKRYKLFKSFHRVKTYVALCRNCGSRCEVPFSPDPNRPVFCQNCWKKRKQFKK